jgi:hypothetical protein
MKICPVGAELFHVDRRTGTMKLIVAFCNYANTPKNIYFISEKCVTVLPVVNWLLKVAWLWQIILCFKISLIMVIEIITI